LSKALIEFRSSKLQHCPFGVLWWPLVSSGNSRKILHVAQNVESSPYNSDAILGGFLLIFHRGILARLKFVRFISSARRRLHAAVETERNYGSQFLILVTCFGLGAAGYLALPFEPQTWVIPSMVMLLLALAALSFSQRGIISSATAVIIATLLGALAVQIEIARLDTVLLDSAVTTNIRGTIERREVDHRGFWRYGLRVDETEGPQLKRPPTYVHIVARQKHPGFEVGDTIIGRARLSPPSGPAFVGANDFAFDAYFNGIGATGFFYSAPKIVEGEAAFDCGSALLLCLDRHLYTFRAAIALHIRNVIGGDAGAFAASIITDERRAISPEVMDVLRQSGLAHIVAISGLNMALAAGIFFVGIRLLMSLSQQITERIAVKKLSAFLALLMTLSYYLISGFPVSAERAWIMTSVMLTAVMLDRQAINLRNVALSALIILVISPSQVMRASFQMSFAATIALVAIYGAYSRRKHGETTLADRGLSQPNFSGGSSSRNDIGDHRHNFCDRRLGDSAIFHRLFQSGFDLWPD
jgi:competence protein ComEC